MPLRQMKEKRFYWWVSHELPVGSHDLAFRADEAALRSGRAGRVELGKITLVPDNGVKRLGIGIEGSSHEPTWRVDPVDAGENRAAHVNRGKDAFVQHEAMGLGIPLRIWGQIRVYNNIKFSYDLVRAISRWLPSRSHRACQSW